MTKEDTSTAEELTKLQLKKLFKVFPGKASQSIAYILHAKGALEPKVQPPLPEKQFADLYRRERNQFRNVRRYDLLKKSRKRFDFNRLNIGYSEPEETFEAEEMEFESEWRLKSIVEDVWKAEYNQHLYRTMEERTPVEGPTPMRSDEMSVVTAEAFRDHVLDQNRPVLTHEFADYTNPYMMKRSALERLVHERCVRNPLDEKVMPRMLDQIPDLVKLRARAPLPPEVFEPIAAFRGDVRWSFDPRERLKQKLEDANKAIDDVLETQKLSDVVPNLRENVEPAAEELDGRFAGIHHPWRNHVGFESMVPTGVAGGTKFGQPTAVLQQQLQKTRYPTLQRVAHTLPKDPKYRAHVVRSIRVLERSKDWDFQSKLNAVNKMKEIYDMLKPSEEYDATLDEKFPLNRVPSHLKRKYAKDKEYVKTYPKKYKQKKAFTIYRRSLFAREPLKISPLKMQHFPNSK